LLDGNRKARWASARNPAAQKGAKDPVHQPPRASLNERQRSCDQRMIGRLKADLLSKRQAQHHPRLAVIGKRLSGRAIDQRIEIRNPAQHFASNCDGKSMIG
jgi:hypothetical protein